MTNAHSAPLSVIQAYVDDLESRLSATRAGYLDNINNANLATISDISDLTSTEIAYLDAKVSEVVKQVALTGHASDSLGKILYDFYNTRLTTARCGYLANINNANLATIADISSFTATEIAHLDADISSRSTLAQSDILSDATPFDGANIDAKISEISAVPVLMSPTLFLAPVATGDMTNPQQINNDTTAHVGGIAINRYVELDFGGLVAFNSYRIYGRASCAGGNVAKITYWTGSAWADWKTGISLTSTAEWGAWDASAGAIITSKIRFICTTFSNPFEFNELSLDFAAPTLGA